MSGYPPEAAIGTECLVVSRILFNATRFADQLLGQLGEVDRQHRRASELTPSVPDRQG
jgi:hypothetical protein